MHMVKISTLWTAQILQRWHPFQITNAYCLTGLTYSILYRSLSLEHLRISQNNHNPYFISSYFYSFAYVFKIVVEDSKQKCLLAFVTGEKKTYHIQLLSSAVALDIKHTPCPQQFGNFRQWSVCFHKNEDFAHVNLKYWA